MKPNDASGRAAVVVLDLERLEVDPFDAAHVDGRHGLPVRSGSLAERSRAARGTEVVLDDVLVEHVRRHVLGLRPQLELLARHEPQQRSLALAHRAVARQHFADLAFHVVGDLAAMTAASIVHPLPPFVPYSHTEMASIASARWTLGRSHMRFAHAVYAGKLAAIS